MTDKIIIGKEKEGIKAKKKYRILIQERKSCDNEIEKMRSFMIQDFTGKTTIDGVKKRIFSNLKK